MPKYHVEFDIETDNEPSDTLLDNALLAGIRLARPIFAQHGTKVKDSDCEYDLAWQKRLSDAEETTDDAQRDSSAEGTSAPPASSGDAADSEPPPAT